MTNSNVCLSLRCNSNTELQAVVAEIAELVGWYDREGLTLETYWHSKSSARDGFRLIQDQFPEVEVSRG